MGIGHGECVFDRSIGLAVREKETTGVAVLGSIAGFLKIDVLWFGDGSWEPLWAGHAAPVRQRALTGRHFEAGPWPGT